MSQQWVDRLRRLWWRHIRRHRYEICRRCGRPVGVVWQAPDSLWSEVEGGPYGVRCIPCFDQDAQEKGIIVYWHPSVEWRA